MNRAREVKGRCDEELAAVRRAPHVPCVIVVRIKRDQTRWTVRHASCAGRITDQRSMAGTAPTQLVHQNARRGAGPLQRVVIAHPDRQLPSIQVRNVLATDFG
jgi:hypothetical protein